MNRAGDSADTELRNLLKAWVNQQPPPKDARAQLLRSAANLKAEQLNKKSVHYQNTNLPADLFSWAIVYCIDRRITMLRLVS